jgi:tetratricopeptide (TPR) repeat protein
MRKVVMIAAMFVAMGTTAQTPKQWRDSVSVLIEQINLYPQNLELRLKKAEANINLQQWEYARDEYTAVLKKDEKNLAALYFRAFCQTQLRQYSFARADYEAFLAIQPEHLEARLGLAHVLQLMGRKTDAVDELNRAVQMFPDSTDAYAARAAFETQQQQYDAALYDWDEALRLAPKNAELVVSKVDVLLRLGRKKEARAALDQAVKQGINRAALREWYDKCK